MTDHEHNWVDGFCTNCGMAYDDFKAQVKAAGAAIVDAVNMPAVDEHAEPSE